MGAIDTWGVGEEVGLEPVDIGVFLERRQNKANAFDFGEVGQGGVGEFLGVFEAVDDFAARLVGLEFAQGAVEGAFMTATVAGEAIELAGDVFVGEGAGDEGFGFEGVDAAEIPARGQELFEESDLEGAGGGQLGAVLGFELGEGLCLVLAEEEAAGEVVPVGVLADGGFAGGGAGSGGALGVLAVGGLAGGG